MSEKGRGELDVAVLAMRQLSRAKAMHPKIDFSRAVYINNRAKWDLSCNECGYSWSATPRNTLVGCGCPRCAGKIVYPNQRIARAKAMHPTIDFGEAVYINSKTKWVLLCNLCSHRWKARPAHTLSGSGCPRCTRRLVTPQKQVARAKAMHPTIDFSKAVYTGVGDRWELSCGECGHEWAPLTNSTLAGHGCPLCASPHTERWIAKHLHSIGVEFDFQKTFEDLRYKAPLFFDFWINSMRIAIEYHGRQHYEPVAFYRGVKGLAIQQEADQVKREWVLANKAVMAEISYKANVDEVKGIIESMLSDGDVSSYVGLVQVTSGKQEAKS